MSVMSYFSANYSYQYAVQILSFFWYLFSWTTDIYVWEEKKKRVVLQERKKVNLVIQVEVSKWKALIADRIIDVILRIAPNKQKNA